jgi:hypothetical protein
MKKIVFTSLLIGFISIAAFSQNSRKGFEYSGTKARYSMLGKSRMFSEGIKPTEFSVFWNKKKNTFTVNAGPKEKWYVIELTGLDTIQGNLTHIGFLEGMEKETDLEKRAKSKCEVRILLDKISIKIGESRLEEYLIDGASVWNDQATGNSK